MDLKDKTYNELLQLRSDLFDKGLEITTAQTSSAEEFKKAKEAHYKETEARMKEFTATQEAEKKVAEAIKNHPDNPKNKPIEPIIEIKKE